ncbi:IS3 family transposase [Ramlibacter terrae]|uniref:IS3 family transposase n=1 Tax=Ramlibacter terrae TaxID=2732511 RepID=A0ABX6P6J3_9BURK|nr:IS3 family transposase [Ramlibacter terrae]
MEASRQDFPMQMMCELHGVTRSGFYAWRKSQPSRRDQDDEALRERVRQIHADRCGFYGSPRVQGQLWLDGHSVRRRRVTKLMREAGLQGRSARLYRNSKVLQRAFYAGVPYRPESATTHQQDPVWVGDVTYLKVAGQCRYMAAVMDKHTRKIIGWSLGARRDAALTREALVQSAWSRRVSPGVAFHSDRGIEFANFGFRKQLGELGMVQSMNRLGRMNDNAHMESFFHSMQCEELYGKRFDTEQQLRSSLSSYIRFYNDRRLHLSLRYLPPTVYESRMQGASSVI